MGGKGAIALGVLAGVLAGSVALLALVLALPSGSLPASSSPSPAVGASASPLPSGSTAAVASPSVSATASPGGASPSASASASDDGFDPAALFGIGKPAPALALPLADGSGTVDLASLRGRPVWVNFMATWCPSCVDELPIMSGFAARYASAGLVVVAVDVKEDPATAAAFTRRLGVTFPVAVDADGSTITAWGALALPVHFWVDASGIIRDGAVGQVGPDLMADALSRILPGVTVTP